MKNLRITVRVEEVDREKIELLKAKSQFKSLSHIMRTALKQFLDMQEVNQNATK
jgi:Arc/MetJ-type ribon-helix-helix transcriptional regulator